MHSQARFTSNRSKYIFHNARAELGSSKTNRLYTDFNAHEISEHPEGCSENTLALLGFFAAQRKICDFPYIFIQVAVAMKI
jgi:hypothetical protein